MEKDAREVVSAAGSGKVVFRGAICDVVLILGGVLLLFIGIVCHIILRPHRVVASNYLQGFGLCLSAAVLIIASKLVSDPLDVSAGDAYRVVTMIQVALSVCRFTHLGISFLYMRLYGSDVFEISEPDGALLSPSTSTEQEQHHQPNSHPDTTSSSPSFANQQDASGHPRWVFDIHSRCCFSSHSPAATLLPPLLPLRNPKLNNTQFSEQFISSVVNDSEEGYVPTTDRPTLVEEDTGDDGGVQQQGASSGGPPLRGRSLDDLLELESREGTITSDSSDDSLQLSSHEAGGSPLHDRIGKKSTSQVSSLQSSILQHSDTDSDL